MAAIRGEALQAAGPTPGERVRGEQRGERGWKEIWPGGETKRCCSAAAPAEEERDVNELCSCARSALAVVVVSSVNMKNSSCGACCVMRDLCH